jgi:hypothetical protein
MVGAVLVGCVFIVPFVYAGVEIAREMHVAEYLVDARRTGNKRPARAFGPTHRQGTEVSTAYTPQPSQRPDRPAVTKLECKATSLQSGFRGVPRVPSMISAKKFRKRLARSGIVRVSTS